MRRKFITHSATYTVAQVAARGMSILLLPFYTRVLVPADYGVLDVVTVTTMLANVVIALEISQAFGRFYSDEKDATARRLVMSTAFWFTAFSYAVFCLVCLAAARPIAAHLIGSAGRANLIRLASVSLFFQGLAYTAQEFLRWDLRTRAYATVSLVSAAVLIGVSAVAVLGTHLGVTGIFIGQVAGNLVGAAIPLWLVWRNLVARVSRPLLRAMLSFSVPLVPASVAVILTQVIDRLAINAFMSLRDVGRYGIAYRIASLVSLGLSGAQLSFTPLVLANHKDATTPRAVADSLRYFVAVALTLFVFLSVFADVVLNILTPGAYHSASSVVPLLVLVVAISPLYIFAPGLVIAREMKKLAVTYIATALINTALVCALVPLFGVMGAAISTLAAFAFSNAVQFTLSQRRYPVPYPWARLSAAFGSAATAVLIDRIVFTHGLSIQELLGKSVIACLALLLIGRSLIDRGELRQLRERIPFLRPRPQPSGTT